MAPGALDAPSQSWNILSRALGLVWGQVSLAEVWILVVWFDYFGRGDTLRFSGANVGPTLVSCDRRVVAT